MKLNIAVEGLKLGRGERHPGDLDSDEVVGESIKEEAVSRLASFRAAQLVDSVDVHRSALLVHCVEPLVVEEGVHESAAVSILISRCFLV